MEEIRIKIRPRYKRIVKIPGVFVSHYKILRKYNSVYKSILYSAYVSWLLIKY